MRKSRIKVVCVLGLISAFVLSFGSPETLVSARQEDDLTVLDGLTNYSGAHLWLRLDPSVYISDHEDPWLVDSYVLSVDYEPNKEYDFSLIIYNRGKEDADVYVLIAIPETTTALMFSHLNMSGGEDKHRTYYLSNFGREDYNPYYMDKVWADEWPFRSHRGGSHGVYPPSGNAIWATYHAGILEQRGEIGDTLTLSVQVKLGPEPDDSFKVHFDAYSLYPGGDLQYIVPPSHDATFCSSVLAVKLPLVAVDVSGDNRYIAAGGGDAVYFFSTFADPEDKLIWTRHVGLTIISLALSEDGSYLAVASNEIPFTGSSRAKISIFRTSDGEEILTQWLDHNVLRATKGIDITRNGSYVAAGTAAWAQGQDSCKDENGYQLGGSVWRIGNPDLGPPDVKSYFTIACTMSARFSGNGKYLVAGFFWSWLVRVFNVSDLTVRAYVPLDDAVYAVTFDYNGTYIGAGQGDSHYVRRLRFNSSSDKISIVWSSDPDETEGPHHQLVISDDSSYMAVKQERIEKPPTDEFPAFEFFNKSNPPPGEDKSPEWIFGASVDAPPAVDLSLWNSLYMVGVSGYDVYLWGNGSEPPHSEVPNYTYVTYGNTTDAAISYDGQIFAVTDILGYLYVFDTSLPDEKLYWIWH